MQLRTRGDFERRIDTIFVDLTYDDDRNRYRQTSSIALSKDKRFTDWSFPVVDERAGKVTYHAITTFKDGTSSDSGDQTLTGTTLLLGEDTATLTVKLIPDLIDWNVVKLASIELHYTDPAHGIDERESFTFRKGAPEAKWELALRDRNSKTYEWTAKFFMQDGSTKREQVARSRGRRGLIIECLPESASPGGARLAEVDAMLYEAPPFYMINGVSIMRDHADPLQFYYMPLAPSFVTRKDGAIDVPQMLLIKYRSATRVGGFADFDVHLGMSGERDGRRAPAAPAPGQSRSACRDRLAGAGRGWQREADALRPDERRRAGSRRPRLRPHHQSRGQAGALRRQPRRVLGGARRPRRHHPRSGDARRDGADRRRLRARLPRPAAGLPREAAHRLGPGAGHHGHDLRARRALHLGPDPGHGREARRAARHRLRGRHLRSRGRRRHGHRAARRGRRARARHDHRRVLRELDRSAAPGARRLGQGGGHHQVVRAAALRSRSGVFSYKKTHYSRIDQKRLDVDFSERITIKRSMYPQGHLSGLFRVFGQGLDPNRLVIRSTPTIRGSSGARSASSRGRTSPTIRCAR